MFYFMNKKIYIAIWLFFLAYHIIAFFRIIPQKKISLQSKRFNVMKLVWDDHWVSFFFFFFRVTDQVYFFLTVGISIISVQQKIPFQFLAFSFISHSIETKQNLSVSKNIKCPYRVAIPSLDLSPSGCGVIHSEYFKRKYDLWFIIHRKVCSVPFQHYNI